MTRPPQAKTPSPTKQRKHENPTEDEEKPKALARPRRPNNGANGLAGTIRTAKSGPRHSGATAMVVSRGVPIHLSHTKQTSHMANPSSSVSHCPDGGAMSMGGGLHQLGTHRHLSLLWTLGIMVITDAMSGGLHHLGTCRHLILLTDPRILAVTNLFGCSPGPAAMSLLAQAGVISWPLPCPSRTVRRTFCTWIFSLAWPRLLPAPW